MTHHQPPEPTGRILPPRPAHEPRQPAGSWPVPPPAPAGHPNTPQPPPVPARYPNAPQPPPVPTRYPSAPQPRPSGWPGAGHSNVLQPNELPKPKRSAKKIILGALLAVAVAGGAYGVWYQFIRVPQIEVFGFMTLNGKSTSSMGNCSGRGGYSDISNGTSVTIRDAENTIIATTHLENGSGSTGMGCMFEFTTTIPGKSDYYSVEVGHRGEVQYDRDGIRLPMMTLGDD